MNNVRKLLDLIGYESFFNGRMYPISNIIYKKSALIGERYVHEYNVKSPRTNKYSKVTVTNNGTKLYGYECDCKNFDNMLTCEHVGAVLFYYLDDIMEYEYVDELKVSRSILKKFDLSKKENYGIKKKVNIEIEFEMKSNDIYFRLRVGDTSFYTLSTESKFLDFIKAVKNDETYEFGKKFTYDSSKYYFDKKDRDIIKFLCNYKKTNYNYYYRTNSLSLTPREFEYFLKLLGNRTFKIKDYGVINHVEHGFPTNYQLTLKENKYQLYIDDFTEYKFWDNEGRYVLFKDGLYLLTDVEIDYLNMLKQNKISTLIFEKKDLSKFSDGLFRKIKDNIIIDENISELTLPTKPEICLYFDILYYNLECKIIFNYAGTEVNVFNNVNILRDKEKEEEIIQELSSYGFYEKQDKMIMDDENFIYDFIDSTLPTLSEKYKIFTSQKIDNTNIVKKVATTSNFSIGKDGIMSYDFSVEGIDQKELENVFTALRAKKRYYRLKNNSVISLQGNEELDNLNNLLDDLDISGRDIESGNVQIPKYRALYIDSLKSNKYKSIKTNNLFDEFISNFKKYKNIEITFDEEEDKILRDYQKQGIKWLTTIYKCDLGGILADEMGLGKSLQTISFIKQILKEKENAKILIVAPTSLIYNWQKEFEKFAPNLKYTVVAENKLKRKEILENQENYNIFITTYGLIRNDNDEYENMNFELCVIDEAQMIKNYQANMTKEVKKIKAKCKIALTGTPVENNVTELWSIFDFIMPGYLNSVLKFRQKYNISDVTEEDLQRLKSLNYQIKPFILRRKKSEVAKSLPDKIESKIYVELPEKQKMLYLNELNNTKREMDEMIAIQGFQKARMKVLQLLMKLRQICIDPSVMYENYDGESIKIESLLNIVKENIANGHKVLIFSSFKRILDNVKTLFENEKISSYMIDGSVKSKDRMEMVEAFNKDETNCFLITLKSGGTGLNLVGADVVIHLDIWWNPQVENQATDRAHRIGQDKNVNVIKIISKGTIEERIIELQEKKKILSDNLIEGKESAQNLTSLTEKDIKQILAYSEEDKN